MGRTRQKVWGTAAALVAAASLLSMTGCGSDDACNSERTLFAGVGGTIEGLPDGESVELRLTYAGEEEVQSFDEPDFLFRGVGLPNCTEFEVTLSAQPSSAECSVEDGVGMIVDGAYLDVAVVCE